MIRSHVLSVLKSTSSQVKPLYGIEILIGFVKMEMPKNTLHYIHQVLAAIRNSGGSKSGVSEGVETSVIYVRFKAAASEVIMLVLCFCLLARIIYCLNIHGDGA